MRDDRGRKKVKGPAPPSENPRTGHPAQHRTRQETNAASKSGTQRRPPSSFILPGGNLVKYGAALSWDFQLALVRFQSGPRLAIFHKVFHQRGEIRRKFRIGFEILLILRLVDFQWFLV